MTTKLTPALVAAAIVTLIFTPIWAQYGPLYTIVGHSVYQGIGWSAAGVGDLDKDGHADFAIGGYGNLNEGSVFIYSGKSGARIFEMHGATEGDYLGVSVANAGDVNKDGWTDIIIGAPGYPGGGYNSGSAYVYSGNDASLLHQVNGTVEHEGLGNSVAGTGDLNGDGYPDFIVGAPSYPPGGAVFVYSGYDGSLLFQKTGLAQDEFGLSVAALGDVNNDGTNDFIVGADETDPDGISNAGSVYIYSGRTGDLLLQKDGNFTNQDFGLSVAALGDINLDGTPDFMLGAPRNGAVSGSVYIYSGADGGLIYNKSGSYPYDRFGFSIAGTGDVDDDDVPDFLVSSATPAGEQAFLYSGATGQLLDKKSGAIVAGAGDVNANGLNDFIVGAPGGGGGGSAIVYARDTVPPSVSCMNDTVLNNFPTVCLQTIRTSTISVSDNFPNPSVVCSPPVTRFGFPVGSTQVVCVGTDQAGNKDSCSFTVTVKDVEPPSAGCPNDTALCIPPNLSGKAVSFSPNPKDNCPSVTSECTPPSGSTFPVGTTSVTCIAADLAGFEDTCQFAVTVQLDSVPPVLQCPNNITVMSDSIRCEIPLNYSPLAATDNCSGPVTITCNPPPGTSFSVGNHVVTCSATDGSGNQGACSFSVTVTAVKGDLNGDRHLATNDVVLLLNCIFLNTGNCGLCHADVNCSGDLTPSDIVLELKAVVLRIPFPCT